MADVVDGDFGARAEMDARDLAYWEEIQEMKEEAEMAGGNGDAAQRQSFWQTRSRASKQLGPFAQSGKFMWRRKEPDSRG